MTFYAKPITYRSDHARVTFAASYLTDHAQKHYITLLQHGAGHPATQTWVDFVSEFGYMFGVVNTQVEAQQNLRILQMHDRERFSTFIIRFEENSFESGWNDAALLSELYRALPTRIKEVLKTLPRSRTVQELRDLVMSIDLRHWEYEEENRRTATRINWVPPVRQPQARPSTEPRTEGQDSRASRPVPERRNPVPQDARPPSSNRPRPADRRSDMPRISPEERERRRRENLCYRCGGEGHVGSNCPRYPTISRAIFTVDGEEVTEEYDEEEPEPDPPDSTEESTENVQAIQELPGTD
jgi:Zinc knuckle./Retrotransposon gag protein.